MPTQTRIPIPYDVAYRAAEEARRALAPFCSEIVIAGSLRRQKAYVKDAEIVCIPTYESAGLFSDALEVNPDFCAVIRRWPKVKGEPTGRYTQRVLPSGLMLDLFIADADNWGGILLIRTGDWEFSKWLMGTVLPRRGYQARDGAIWRDGVKVPTPQEQDVFDLAGMDWIDPCRRIGRR